MGPLSYLDVGLIAIAFISGMLAMYRGLTREVLSLVSWALAGAVTLYFVFNHRDVAKDVADQIFKGQELLALIVLAALIFVVVLIVVHFITVRISDRVLDSRVGMIDRIFGFVFGAARGFLLVVIVHLGLSFAFGDENLPNWINDSASIGYIRSTGKAVQSLVQGFTPENLSIPGFGKGDSERSAIDGAWRAAAASREIGIAAKPG